MKTYLFSILFLGSLFIACNEKGLDVLSGDMAYLSFSSDPTKDSTVLSFVAYPSGEIDVDIEIEIRGNLLDEPREYTLSVDKEKSTFLADYCELPEKCVFPAGQTKDTVRATFLNYAALKDMSHRIFLKIDEGENVKEGDKAFRRALFILSDKIARPMWWTVKNVGWNGNLTKNLAEESYLGLYSDKKYTMFLEELAKDGVEFDGQNVIILKKYSLRLKYRIEEFNNDPANIAAGLTPLWDEENTQAMTLPVRG